MRKLSGWWMALAIFFACPAMAQTPPSYAVTYIELKTDQAAAGRRALADYAAASRKEKGNLQFELLQESARPSRFNMPEVVSL